MAKQRTQFGSYTIQANDTLECIAPNRPKEVFNKLWIYPGARLASGRLSVNAGTVYLGEEGDGPTTTPDALAPDDAPLKIELPAGEMKRLSEVWIQGTAADSIWFKYWLDN